MTADFKSAVRIASKEPPRAFPVVAFADNTFFVDIGMSLRDYFAAKAMASYIVNVEYGATLQRIFDPTSSIADAGPRDETPMSYLARLAYAQADAMISERTKFNESAKS